MVRLNQDEKGSDEKGSDEEGSDEDEEEDEVNEDIVYFVWIVRSIGDVMLANGQRRYNSPYVSHSFFRTYPLNQWSVRRP
jgi:hypothetical protein